MLKRFLCALVTAVALAGCASTPSNDRNIRIATETGTLLLIQKADIPAAKANRVLDTIADVRAKLDTSESVSVIDLRVTIVRRVTEKYELNPAEQLLALEFINAISDRIEFEIGSGALSPDARVTVGKILDAAETVALLYVPH